MFIFLFIFWLLLNGRVTVEICLFGLVICGAVYLFLCRFMDYRPSYDRTVFQFIPWFFRYFAALLKEICKANLTMMGFVFTLSRIAEPALITFTVPLRTPFARTLLANSITLTPGTITVSLQDSVYRVHCYDKSMAEGITDSVFVRLLLEMEALL